MNVTWQGWELKDNYVEGLAVYYLNEGYRELALERPARILYDGPYYYLALEDEADIAAFFEDASRLMQYAVSQTPFFEEYRGMLYFMHMEGKREVTGGIPFGSLEGYASNGRIRKCLPQSSSSSDSGSEKINSLPAPSVLMTLIFSPWQLMISFTMDSPSPVPFLSLPRDRSDL